MHERNYSCRRQVNKAVPYDKPGYHGHYCSGKTCQSLYRESSGLSADQYTGTQIMMDAYQKYSTARFRLNTRNLLCQRS